MPIPAHDGQATPSTRNFRSRRRICGPCAMILWRGGRYMTSDPDWHKALARVSGQLVHGEQRVTTRELLTVHLGVPVTDRACRRPRRVLWAIGGPGPRLERKDEQSIKA